MTAGRSPWLVIAASLLAISVAGCGNGSGGTGKAASSPSPPTRPTTTGTTTAPAAPCASTQLTAAAVAQASGASTPGTGVIAVSDVGKTPCSLQGYLGVALPDQAGRFLAVEVIHDGIVGPKGFQSAGAPAHPTPVLLSPGMVPGAWVGVRWRNWCGRSLTQITVSLVLPQGGEIPVPPQGLWPSTRCSGATAPDVLQEGPVQQPTT